jgi:acetyltransferase-like isoleucine patch superfamily enzyme
MDNSSPQIESVHRGHSVYDYVRGLTFNTLYGCVKYLPMPIGNIFRYACLKLFMKELHTWRIKDGVTFCFPHGISIGKNVSINEWVLIDGLGGVEIGDYCRIAHSCSFLSEDHSFQRTDIPICKQKAELGRIVIGKDVWFGAGVRVMKNVTIGNGCVIGAGAVVTKDIPPYSIAAGVPAKVVRSRLNDGETPAFPSDFAS